MIENIRKTPLRGNAPSLATTRYIGVSSAQRHAVTALFASLALCLVGACESEEGPESVGARKVSPKTVSPAATNTQPDTQPNTQPDTNAGSTRSDEAVKLEKETRDMIDTYVKCFNRASDRALDSRKRYFRWASQDPKKLPTGKEKLISHGLFQFYSDSCLKGLAKLKDPGFPALFEAGKAYGIALGNITKIGEKAHRYYKESDYKDDGAAKAKEMHPILVRDFQSFVDADKAFRIEFDLVTNARAVKRLAELESQDGSRSPYLRAKILYDAKKLIEWIDSAAEEKDVESLKAQIVSFVALSEEFESYVNENPRKSKPGEGIVPSMSGTVTAANNFRRAIKEYGRAAAKAGKGKRDQRKIASLSSKVFSNYNSLVGASNRAR